MIWEGEDGDVRRVTYRELRELTDRLAHGLRSLGVGSGTPSASSCRWPPRSWRRSLACAKLGAIYLPIFSGYGAEAVADPAGGRRRRRC